jgi:hypothetical protein
MAIQRLVDIHATPPKEGTTAKKLADGCVKRALSNPKGFRFKEKMTKDTDRNPVNRRYL